MGGYHSRYYICAMPSFVILISKVIDKEENKKTKNVIIILATIVYAVLMQLILF